MKNSLLFLILFSLLVSCSSDEISTLVIPENTPEAVISKYTITFIAGDGGSVSTTGGEYKIGETVKVAATPKGDYLFSHWCDGTSDATRTITVRSNKSTTAYFEKKKYPLTVIIDGKGEVLEEVVNAGRSTEYNSGTYVKLTAKPSEGWDFVGWTGAIESADIKVQILVSELKEIHAEFTFHPIENNLFMKSFDYFSDNLKAGDILSLNGVLMTVHDISVIENSIWKSWIENQYGVSESIGYILLLPLNCYSTALTTELIFNSQNGDFLMARHNNLTSQGQNYDMLIKRDYLDTFSPHFNDNSYTKYFKNVDYAFYSSAAYLRTLKSIEVGTYNFTIKTSQGGLLRLKNRDTGDVQDITEDKILTYTSCDSYQLVAIPSNGHYFSSWTNDSANEYYNITPSSNEAKAVFKLQNSMNGWYSIKGENNDLINYPNNYPDSLLLYFENNVFKNIASMEPVKDYWNLDSDDRAIVFKGNEWFVGSDYFGFNNGRNDISMTAKFESFIQKRDHIFLIQKVFIDGRTPKNYQVIKFDFENTKKMTDYYSESGYLSDSVYSKIDPNNIRSYISAFFKDIERYGGQTKYKEEDVRVVFENYGGWGAFAGGFCDTPTIYLDRYWFDSSMTNLYDKQNDGMGIIYHELGHAIFGLDHLCRSGQIMTGWHGSRGGVECRGEKTSENIITAFDLSLPESRDNYNWNRAVKDLVTLNDQFPYDCKTGTGKGSIMVY
jgi:hypothetical protein